jgi:hypothetical protein
MVAIRVSILVGIVSTVAILAGLGMYPVRRGRAAIMIMNTLPVMVIWVHIGRGLGMGATDVKRLSDKQIAEAMTTEGGGIIIRKLEGAGERIT